MAILNIVDKRHQPVHRLDTFCDAVMEISSDDWTLYGLPSTTENRTEWITGTTVYSAIMTAMKFRGEVVLYFYSCKTLEHIKPYLHKSHPSLRAKQFDPTKVDKDIYIG